MPKRHDPTGLPEKTSVGAVPDNNALVSAPLLPQVFVLLLFLSWF